VGNESTFVSIHSSIHVFLKPFAVARIRTTKTDYGVEKAVSVQGLDSGAIATKLQDLVKAGEALPRSGE
jgi:hypothetical protein